MKVLLIDVNCKYSSTGKIVYSLFQNLKEEGHEVAVCYGRGSVINEEGVYKFGLDWETYIHAGISRITGRNGYYSFVSTLRLIKFIAEFKPDIIHIHELHGYFVNIASLITFLKKQKCKIVWTFHCEYMYTGKCGYTYECNRWLNKCGNCPDVKGYPKSLLFDRTKEMLKHKKHYLDEFDFTIVTPSKWLADKTRVSFLGEHEIKVIHNGIDVYGIFRPMDILPDLAKEIPKRSKIILSVAPNIMDSRKGGNYVLKLAEMMREDDAFFVMVGADETKKYSNNVYMIQRTKNQEELARWYSFADCFLICSTMENFPTTCLEALSCGTPVIGFDCGGTAETACEPYGHFCDFGDLNGLRRIIQKHTSSHDFSELVRKYAEDNYDMKIMSNQYIDLYKNLLK